MLIQNNSKSNYKFKNNKKFKVISESFFNRTTTTSYFFSFLKFWNIFLYIKIERLVKKFKVY